MAHGYAGSGLSIVGPAISAAGASAGVGTVVFSNSNGVTFGMAGSTVTASVAAGGGGLTNINVSAGTTSNLLSAITFSNANNVSFGLNASVVTATATVATSLSNIRVSAGTTSNLLSALTFANSNGVTFGLNASTLTASHDGLTSQSNQAFSAQGGSSAFQTLSFSNANGASFSNNAGQVQLSYTVPTVTNSSWTVSDNVTSLTVARLAFTAANGMTLSLSTTTGGSATVVGSYTRPVVSNAIQSVGSATNSGTNTSRFAADDHVHAGVFSLGVSTGGNTIGNTRVDVGQFVFQGGNNITLSQITAANGLNTVLFSGAAAGGAQTGISGIQVSNTTYTSGTVTWQNANGISFGSSGANGVSASYTVPTVTNSSMTVSDAATSGTLARLAFTNLNGVTLSLSTGAAGSHTIVGSHNGLTSQSNQAFSAAGGSSAFQTLGFSDNANVSFTNTNGSVAVMGVRASLFAVSNTTQSSSGTQNLAALSFAGAGGVSLGDTNGSVVISGGAGGAGDGGNVLAAGTRTATSLGTVLFSNSNGVTFGLDAVNGSQITASVYAPVTFTSWCPAPFAEVVSNNAGQGVINIIPAECGHVEFDRVVMLGQVSNATNSSGSQTLSYRFAVYTRTSNSISLLTSAIGTYAMTQSGTAGSYSLYSGLRLYTIGLTSTLTAGQYYFAANSNTTSGGANATLNAFGVSNIGSNLVGMWSSSNASSQQAHLGRGVYSVSSTAFPGSIAFTQIQGSGNQAWRAPWFVLQSSTV